MSAEVISMKDFMITKAKLEGDWDAIDETMDEEAEAQYDELMFAAGVFADLAEYGDYDGQDLLKAYEIIAKTVLAIVAESETAEEQEDDS